MITPILLIIIGFACLIFGGNWLVDGASALAKRNNISDLVIGLTIVSFGTSAPELVVNSLASFEGHSDIVFGNIIGSNNQLIHYTWNLCFDLSDNGSNHDRSKRNPHIASRCYCAFTSPMIFIDRETEASRLDGIILLTFLFFLYYVFMQQK